MSVYSLNFRRKNPPTLNKLFTRFIKIKLKSSKMKQNKHILEQLTRNETVLLVKSEHEPEQNS